MQLWRNEGRNGRTSIQSHPGNIAPKNVIFPLINIVMVGVSRRRNGTHFKGTNPDDGHVVQNREALLSNGRELPPKPLHFIAVNAPGRVDEFRRINEMRRTARMDINGGAKFRETPGGPGMIEMDVTEKHVPDLFSGETRLFELFDYVPKSRLWAGIEEDKSIVSLDRCRRDDASPAELLRVENMDH